ncbi:MAG: polyprenyl synthetase family protein [Acidobacteria bacterium]|nr:polyprenyl synthetase family protein [Acidobacteriota bacterium]
MKAEADGWLGRLLPGADEPPAVLHRAMRHSVFAGGKRLRAVLVASTAEALGFREPERFAPAAAVEMIHTYSLIHDDLPAMDDDDFRRGVPTCHKLFGEALAILAGDALLTLAFRVLALHPEGSAFEGVRARVVGEMALAAGTPAGMVAGQVLDITAPGGGGGVGLLREIHRLKTGALIRGSVRCGALLAGADGPVLDALTRYAEWLGMAFQVTDDILDETATREDLGKTPGKDARQAKLTYPSLFGLERSRELAAEFVGNAVGALDEIDDAGDFAFLRHVARAVLDRRS